MSKSYKRAPYRVNRAMMRMHGYDPASPYDRKEYSLVMEEGRTMELIMDQVTAHNWGLKMLKEKSSVLN